jgi:ABC-type Na+ efflux pump permease subunit
MVQMGAMALLNSVMEEKNQRIAEVLLSSITPFEFIIGKVAGIHAGLSGGRKSRSSRIPILGRNPG